MVGTTTEWRRGCVSSWRAQTDEIRLDGLHVLSLAAVPEPAAPSLTRIQLDWPAALRAIGFGLDECELLRLSPGVRQTVKRLFAVRW